MQLQSAVAAAAAAAALLLLSPSGAVQLTGAQTLNAKPSSQALDANPLIIPPQNSKSQP